MMKMKSKFYVVLAVSLLQTISFYAAEAANAEPDYAGLTTIPAMRSAANQLIAECNALVTLLTPVASHPAPVAPAPVLVPMTPEHMDLVGKALMAEAYTLSMSLNAAFFPAAIEPTPAASATTWSLSEATGYLRNFADAGMSLLWDATQTKKAE